MFLTQTHEPIKATAQYIFHFLGEIFQHETYVNQTERRSKGYISTTIVISHIFDNGSEMTYSKIIRFVQLFRIPLLYFNSRTYWRIRLKNRVFICHNIVKNEIIYFKEKLIKYKVAISVRFN